MIDLRPYLEDIERRINEDEETAIYNSWKQFALGQSPESTTFEPPCRTPKESGIDWKHININDAIADEDLMLLSQLENCHRALSSPTNTLMIMRANYGVGIISSLFGAERFIMPYEMDTLPNVRPLKDGSDAIQRLLDSPAPALTEGYGTHVFSIGERLAEIREQYPKIGRFIRIDNPDGQGPIDNCELLWGSDLFYAFYDEPELVHALLDRVTDTIQRFVKKWQQIFPNTDGLTSYFGRLGRGGIVIRNDSAMNLSPDIFREYIQPYDTRLLQAFDGGMIHFCGTGDHFAGVLAKTPLLSTVDMSQPHLNNMETILGALPDQGINIFVPKGDYSLKHHILHRINAY